MPVRVWAWRMRHDTFGVSIPSQLKLPRKAGSGPPAECWKRHLVEKLCVQSFVPKPLFGSPLQGSLFDNHMGYQPGILYRVTRVVHLPANCLSDYSSTVNAWRHQAITSTNVSIFSIWSLVHDQWKNVSENQNLKKCIYVAFAIDDLAWHIVSLFRSVEAMTYSSWSSCSVDEYATLLGHQHTQCLYNTPDAVSCGMVRDCFLCVLSDRVRSFSYACSG